jgi:hypothetical protein
MAGTAAPGNCACTEAPPSRRLNRFLHESYVAEFNCRFQVAAAQRGTAFTACPWRDLDLIFSLQFERTVGRDNTVSFQNLALQIDKVCLAGHTDRLHGPRPPAPGTLSMTHGPRRLGHYTSQGTPITTTSAAKAVEKTRDSHFPTATTAAG